MKKIICPLVGLVLLVGGYYLYTHWALGNDSVAQTPDEYTTYSQSDIGLEFNYFAGPTGYTINENVTSDLNAGLVKNIILARTQDTISPPPVGSEYPPAIIISVFENTKKQFPRNWADENTQESNIKLIRGDVEEVVVGGANAIQYMTDGLYSSENVVVANDDYIYVITGQYIDQNSPIVRDYEDIIKSIRFIPTPGQS